MSCCFNKFKRVLHCSHLIAFAFSVKCEDQLVQWGFIALQNLPVLDQSECSIPPPLVQHLLDGSHDDGAHSIFLSCQFWWFVKLFLFANCPFLHNESFSKWHSNFANGFRSANLCRKQEVPSFTSKERCEAPCTDNSSAGGGRVGAAKNCDLHGTDHSNSTQRWNFKICWCSHVLET